MYGIDEKARTWAQIDLGAMKHNLDIAKRTGVKVMCVIKANAYGHGAVVCGRFLQENGADAFAVACLSEAVELRENGITLPVLVLGHTPCKYAKTLADLHIEQTAVDEEAARELSAAAKKAGVTVSVHIKIDTGMSRSGVLARGDEHVKSAIDAAERITKLENINVVGMYTHLSVADSPDEDEYTRSQIGYFTAVRDGLEARGIHIETCHASNSAGIMYYPEARFDMVREGIMLYGLYPDSMPNSSGLLKPVMTLKSRVGQVRFLPAGTTVSYDRTYKTERETKTAVVTVGYADGYPRRLSNSTYAVVNGKRCRQIGRICMDMMILDATDIEVERGDEVTLLGEGAMSMEEASQIVGTINYELTCLVTDRAQRVYIYPESV